MRSRRWMVTLSIRVKTDNLVNALSGKIAGVQVKVNNNIGGSTNITDQGLIFTYPE